jgi:hypothetical protein
MYENEPQMFDTDSEFLEAFLEKHGDPNGLRGKNILDLGSGSVNTPYFLFNSFEPLFSRACLEKGAQVIGIDIHPQGPDEKFNWIQADFIELVRNNKLASLLAENGFPKVDIAHISNVFTSPEYMTSLKNLRIRPNDFQQELLGQLLGLISENGYLFLSDAKNIIYQKKEGKFNVVYESEF